MNKWYMLNPTSILENDTHKLFWVFDIHTNPLNSARIIKEKKKKICKIVDLADPADHRINLKEFERGISTSTLLENWKNYGTWKWQLY